MSSRFLAIGVVLLLAAGCQRAENPPSKDSGAPRGDANAQQNGSPAAKTQQIVLAVPEMQ
jgi:hypothetical protein